MIAIYVLIVFFSLTLIAVTPVRVTNKTFVALKKLQLFNGLSIAGRLINFSLSVKMDNGVLLVNDSRAKPKKGNFKGLKQSSLIDLFRVFKPDKVSLSVVLGSTGSPAVFAVTQGTIIMIFDIINNTREGKSPEIATNLTVLQDRNIAEAQLSVTVKINFFMIFRALLLILFSEVKK